MDKDIGKINKNANTDIVVRVDAFGGKPGVTIREFVTGEGYTGFTKAGTRIPADKFLEFKELINAIDVNDLKAEASEVPKEKAKTEKKEEAQEDIEDY